MDKIINDILTEWAYRVHDGMPNPKNPLHLVQLEETLTKLRLPRKVTKKLLQNLREDRIYKSEWPGGKPPKGAKVKVGPRGGKYYDGDKDTLKPDTSGKLKTKEPSEKEIESKKLKDRIGKQSDSSKRIVNEEAKKEFDQDTRDEEINKKEIREALGPALNDMSGDMQENILHLTAIGQLYGRRDNAGFMKNAFGYVDIKQLTRNRKNLIEAYGDGSPEHVEKFVRKVRKNKIPESVVEASFETLPPALKTYLKGAGSGGKKIGKNHFHGYKKNDGTTTTDVNDPDIQKDENGNPVVVRGGVPSKARALLVWRIYLEQGGVCAYTGMPLDLESMDLEHVVGLENSDKGKPTEQDYMDRENEKNHVLTSSRANQNKKDDNMEDFFKGRVDPLTKRSKEEFDKVQKSIESAKPMQTRTEQTAWRQMDDVHYFIKGGGGTISQSEIDDMPAEERPELTLTDLGRPEIADANFNPNVTYDTLEKEFEFEDKEFLEQKTLLKEKLQKEDRSKADQLVSKIGKRTLNSLGLAGNLEDENRRTNKISSDNFYRGFVLSMVDAPPEKRDEYKKAWNDCRKFANSRDEGGKLKNGKTYGKNQKDEFVKCIKSKVKLSDKVLSNPKYAKVWES
tara:strand:- start:3053 stop:4921 length:1869 start_codon:yes stop_codon:yes gene_type:complete